MLMHVASYRHLSAFWTSNIVRMNTKQIVMSELEMGKQKGKVPSGKVSFSLPYIEMTIFGR